MKTNRDRMSEAMADWVRSLGGEYYALYNRHYRELNFEYLKKAITVALDEACADVVAAAADRGLRLMEKLNTDYRHEIADAVRRGIK